MLPRHSPMDSGHQDVRGAISKWARRMTDVNSPCSNDHWNMLQLSCAIGDQSAVRFAVEQGADVNTHCPSRVIPRCTPLHILAKYDQHEIIKTLPGRTNFNKQDQWGFTALHYAVAAGSVNSARILMERGANVLVRSNKGATPVDIAKALDHTELATILQSKLLIESDPAFEQFKHWLESLGAGAYVNAFVSAGYDLPFIQKHGLNDADLDCVTVPATKLGLRKKLIALHQLENFAPAVKSDSAEESEGAESGSEDGSADSES